eukprot:TRINITY_DN9879_c0_g3_i2.p1 TRINITY_DN9879_c0_g3~~TRINITY_DN9879_c0_g3_i2.p1  ORF type:complete len:532 (+),score=139.49 TRINITY_DN9879_c0_g3_i2:40-1635(+)
MVLRLLCALGLAVLICAKPEIRVSDGDVVVKLDSDTSSLHVQVGDSDPVPVVLKTDMDAIVSQMATMQQQFQTLQQTVDNSFSGPVVASFPSEFADIKAGISTPWSLLWNANGPIGQASSYAPLVGNADKSRFSSTGGNPPVSSTVAAGAYWLAITDFGIMHPGSSSAQGATNDRFAILGYNITQAGYYSIVNSSLDLGTERGDGNDIRVFVNDEEKARFFLDDFEGQGLTGSFDTYLGKLMPGDMVYVAAGPGEHAHNDDILVKFDLKTGLATGLDIKADADAYYSAVRTDGLLALKPDGGVTDQLERDIDGVTTVVGLLLNTTDTLRQAINNSGPPQVEYISSFADGFRELKADNGSNWSYFFNSRGPVGNSSNYAAMKPNSARTFWTSTGGVDNAPVTSNNPNDLWWLFVEDGGLVHPGSSSSQNAPYSRYVVLTYTVQQPGSYVIIKSRFDTLSTVGDGNDVIVYVNDEPRNRVYGNTAVATVHSFDTQLGDLLPGDKIQVAIGPGGNNLNNHNDDVNVSFDIIMLS